MLVREDVGGVASGLRVVDLLLFLHREELLDLVVEVSYLVIHALVQRLDVSNYELVERILQTLEELAFLINRLDLLLFEVPLDLVLFDPELPDFIVILRNSVGILFAK